MTIKGGAGKAPPFVVVLNKKPQIDTDEHRFKTLLPAEITKLFSLGKEVEERDVFWGKFTLT